MNPLTIAHRAAARIYSAELTAAAVLEQRPLGRRIMLGWYHRATAPRIVAAATALIVTAALFPSATSSIILLALAAVGYARIADKSHEVINEEDGPATRVRPPAPATAGCGWTGTATTSRTRRRPWTTSTTTGSAPWPATWMHNWPHWFRR